MNLRKKRQIIVVVIVSVIVIIGIILGVILWQNYEIGSQRYTDTTSKITNNKKSKKPTKVKNKTYQKRAQGQYYDNSAQEKKIMQSSDPKAPKYIYRDNISAAGDGGADGNSKELKTKMLQLLASQQYKTYENQMKSNLSAYRFDKGYGLDIVGEYKDEQTFEDIINSSNLGAKEAGEYLAKNIKTPESFAIFGLYMDQIARGRFIIDSDSISPIGFSDLQYKGTDVYNTPEQIKSLPTYNGYNAAEEIFNLTGKNSVYIVHLSILDAGHTIPYDAVIGENTKGQLALLGYYTGNKYIKQITDKPLKYFYSKEMMQQYKNAEENQQNESEHGNVDVSKLYPWIEKGGTIN